MEPFDLAWMTKWQSVVNRDEVMKVIGKHFYANILFEFGDKSFLVYFKNGQIEKIAHQLHQIGPGERWDFALRGSLDLWKKFIEEVPPPRYHSLWALVDPTCHEHPLKIEGDIKVLWQNIRAFTWALELMRRVTKGDK